MKLRLLLSVSTLVLVTSGHALSAIGQRETAVAPRSIGSCQSASTMGMVTIQAPKQSSVQLSLCDGRALAGGASSASMSQPLTLASGDFDSDGVADLISGFASGKGGVITLHRGNVQALWPYGTALRSGPPSAFFSNARSFTLPEAPEFLAIGDFDADGHVDVVTARRGSDALYLLRGDGHGGLSAARRIALAGTVTALLAGEMNKIDGLTDLVVAVQYANGPRVLVYESPNGALAGSPEIFKLPKPATALALGRLDGGAQNDLAVAAGDQLIVIHGRDRKLSLDQAQQATVEKAVVTVQKFPFILKDMISGDFTGTGPSIAALDEDGRVHVLEHSISSTPLAGHALSDPDFKPTIQLAGRGQDGNPVILSGHLAPSVANRFAGMRHSLSHRSESAEWTERSSVSLPGVASHLIAGRVSGSLQEDILVPDSGNRKVHVLSTAVHGRRSSPSIAGKIPSSPEPASMRLLASLEAVTAPAAVLPMRLSRHGLSGLVLLQEGQSSPIVMPQDVTPSGVFMVTNTRDITSVGGDVPEGSLRAAMLAAQTASGDNGGGLYEIDFNIPTSDPGYNSKTGTFLIQPHSESVPGALNDFALPPINATLTIDGYTQPGASPNTLTNGDNAKILIQIDGSNATTPGGSGLVPFDDVGSVYRGLDFTGWTNPDISTGSSGQSTASGAEGIEANGVADFIEGNFFGTDPTGKTAAPNRIGIFADNGPGFGSTASGNIIGGTTPQARNILSSNNNSGVLFLSTALEAQLQGNFIGLDATGKAIVSNPQEADRSNSFDGVGLNGPTIVIGGTLPGTTNFIAGNGTNVDINDLTEGNQANSSIVQGNVIGTDVTGTVAIPNQGYGVSILNNPTNMLIGGTTPAARNIISGNLAGVYIFDNSFYNVVQGNYIGTDITGTKAVPNVDQGFVAGATNSNMIPAGDTTIGGSVAGSGNVISGNGTDGIQIAGTSNGPNGGLQSLQGNLIQGNFIGTDATGKNAVGNRGAGVDLISSATNNIIGGSQPGAGNLIAFNKSSGVLIDPGTANAGEGNGNVTIDNMILSNGGSGVRINSGTGNRISQNSIFANAELGISLDNAGVNLNTHCNATNTGANGSQNAPVLIGGSGAAFISATATDPSGNTSEFSNAVKASGSGNILNLLGTFDSLPSTNYIIEFFSNTAADASGYGQGQTYLSSTSVTTGSDCTIAVNDPVDTSTADLGVSLASDTSEFDVGPDFGQYTLTGTVSNNGPSVAHNVTFTETLPSGLEISSAYCNVGPCQLAATTTLGSCTVNGKKITCNLGTMASGTTATVTLPVEATSTGSLTVSATVNATEKDPKLANNTATLAQNVDYPFPFIDHINSANAVIQTSGSLPLTVYGNGFLPTSAVTFNGTAVKTTGYLDNQVCGGPFEPGFCSAIQVSVPASLLGTAGTETITVTNPDPGSGGEGNEPASTQFTLVPSCTYDAEFFGFNPVEAEGDTLIPESIEVTASAPTCSWTATSNASWLVILDNAKSTGSGSFDVSVAPNTGPARSGTVTVAGQAVEIDQSAGDSTICTYGLNPASGSFPAIGGSGTFAVTTGSSCSYFVEPYPQDSSLVTGVQFITVPQTSSLLVGNGNPVFTVAANHGAPRSGAIMVGGDVYTLTQDAPACYYTLDSTSALIPATGGSGTIGVTASSSSCKWTAKASNTSEVTITSGASTTGNSEVKYTVANNSGGPATPTITIGDASGYSIYTVNQASAFTCTFSLSPSSIEVPSNGSSNFFTVNASFNFCKWTATSSDQTALTVNDVSGQGGLQTNGSSTGSGAVYYRVAQNTTGKPRTLTITAGCETFTVNQDGGAASNPVPTITALQPGSVTAGSGAVSLTVSGSNFISTSVVEFNGSPVATTFVNSTTLTATIPATSVATAGNASITVNNPSPGGGTSNALTFTINGSTNNPAPVITALSPATVQAGSQSFVLTVNGTRFVSNSLVNFNGKTQTTTFVSATQIKASIDAAAVTKAGSIPVTVTNPAPGGGTSNSTTFTITSTTPLPVLAPTALVFSNTTVATTSAPQTVTLTNTGGGTLNISGITLTGANAADFAQTNTCGKTLAANTNCSISVTFTPASAASFSATLSIADDATGSPQIVVLTGTGTTAATPQALLSPTSVSFATTTVGQTSAAQTIKLSNPGTAALTISGITLTGLNPADFTETTTCAATLAAGSSCNISATFTPASAAAFSAVISVADNVTGSPQTVALSGTGISTTAPKVTLSPTSVSFAATTVGTTAPAQTVALTNSGNAVLNISGITLTGANAADFAETTTCAATLAAGSSCNISVTFTPASAAAFSAMISVADNVTGSPQLVSVSGTGTAVPAPAVSLTPASLTFNSNVSVASAAQTATLKNTGNAPLTISSITIGGSGAADFSETTTCGASLNAGTSCSLTVVFTPASAAAYSATLSIADNAAGAPHIVTLGGTGTAAPVPTFTITSSTTAQTVSPGGIAQYSITASAQNGAFANPVTLTTSGLPANATATFTPPSITPGATSATSQLNIQTATASPAATNGGTGWPIALASLPLLGMLLRMHRFRKRWVTLCVLLLSSLGVVTAMTGCGGGFALPGSAAKNYTITITGTSGDVSQSTTVQLTVK